MLPIEKLTFGVGDRFAHQAGAQLQAFEQIAADGVDVTPVWNKSNREHTFVGSQPQSVYDAAEVAVQQRGWGKAWHVDADHIQLATVDAFLPCSDFFTIDVADSIGKPAAAADIAAFVDGHPELIGTLELEGLSAPLEVTREMVQAVAEQYLLAVQEAGKIYQHIIADKGADKTIAEISMDETDSPQTPPELLVILAAIADQNVPIQTIAPKFTGRFNKGVDYVGDLKQFEQEFNDDVAVIAHAVKTYGLPETLKLSVHSGSDKFSLYPIIHECLKRTGAGLHIKTAGTTWLEEIIGLSEAGGDGLALAKEIYAYALEHVEEFCAPYASVIDIDEAKLPSAETVNGWSGEELASAVRHIQGNPNFNPHMRQLLHVSFKVAAKHGDRYTGLLKANAEIVGREVTKNIYERHLRPLFLGSANPGQGGTV
ncbi:tagaturonate epimerase family protein [Neorhodopirellula lusitana]|uniref:tagaturonate epimerase family protein n=1 Tax=Neorhodopirellula lusitana TaxID=445327 RepID=UPI0038516F66